VLSKMNFVSSSKYWLRVLIHPGSVWECMTYQ
jgi:hypothetical protein